MKQMCKAVELVNKIFRSHSERKHFFWSWSPKQLKLKSLDLITMSSRFSHLLLSSAIIQFQRWSTQSAFIHRKTRDFSVPILVYARISSKFSLAKKIHQVSVAFWSFLDTQDSTRQNSSSMQFSWLILIESCTHSPLKAICNLREKKRPKLKCWTFYVAFLLRLMIKKEIAAPWDFKGINLQVALACDEWSFLYWMVNRF